MRIIISTSYTPNTLCHWTLLVCRWKINRVNSARQVLVMAADGGTVWSASDRLSQQHTCNIVLDNVRAGAFFYSRRRRLRPASVPRRRQGRTQDFRLSQGSGSRFIEQRTSVFIVTVIYFVVIVFLLFSVCDMLLVVKGGQLWWANAFSGSLSLYYFQCYSFVLYVTW